MSIIKLSCLIKNKGQSEIYWKFWKHTARDSVINISAANTKSLYYTMKKISWNLEW